MRMRTRAHTVARSEHIADLYLHPWPGDLRLILGGSFFNVPDKKYTGEKAYPEGLHELKEVTPAPKPKPTPPPPPGATAAPVAAAGQSPPVRDFFFTIKKGTTRAFFFTTIRDHHHHLK